MSIDSLIGERDRINIKELVGMDPPEKAKLPFDRNSIPESVMQFAIDGLRNVDQKEDISGYISRSRNLFIAHQLDPESPLIPEMIDALRKNKENVAQEIQFSNDNKLLMDTFLEKASAVKIIDPNLTRNIKISDDDWQEIAKHISELVKDTTNVTPTANMSLYKRYLHLLANAKIINPDILSLVPGFKENREGIKKAFEFSKTEDKVEVAFGIGSVGIPSLQIAESLKILEPGLFDELSVNDSDWKRWNECMEKISEYESWPIQEYMPYAAMLVIVESDKVETKNSSFNIVMPVQQKTLDVDQNSFPERRRF